MSKCNSSRLILASTSPRRKQLLSEAGYRFKVLVPDIDESAFSTYHINPTDYVKKLALAKAKSVSVNRPRRLVIGADTVVDFEGEAIGKPRDSKDAEKIVRKIFGAPHKVITGLAIVRPLDNIQVVESDITTVYPKKLTNSQIVQYIKSNAWKDKAGAYAIQENSDEFIEKIEGSLTNVMGLPMELLERMLKKITKILSNGK